jgi:hypothetical protein
VYDTVVKVKKVIVCPACGQTIEAIVCDGVIKGLCAMTGKQVFIKLDAADNQIIKE